MLRFALAGILLCLAAAPAAATRALLARIDNPELHNGTMTCSAREMERVSDTINDAISKRRRLLGGDGEARRGLVPRRCQGGCQRAPAYCQFMGIGCVVQNRRRLEDTHPFLRQLGEPKPPKPAEDDKNCFKLVTEIEKNLQSVAATLSSPCRDMVEREKHFSCVEVVPCAVSHFALWNVATNAVIVPVVPAKGTSICQNVKFTFEAVVNFDSGPLQFSIAEKKKISYNSDVSYSEPYFMMAGSPSNSTLQGLTLSPGTYEVTAWPENDMTKQSMAEFTVKKC